MTLGSPAPSESGQTKRSRKESILAISGLCFLMMMVAVDQTVVGTTLPTIIADLKGFELYAWVATAYLLTCVITVPVFGRLGDYYGRKPFVIASILIFSLASVGCAAAVSMEMLVAARALQGVGGGMLIGTAFACVPDLFPDARTRLRWQVLLSASYGIASAFGPTFGGFLTQHTGWRSVFLINLPLGFVSLYMVWRYLPYIRQVSGARVRLDWGGAILIAIGLTALQFFLEFVPRGDTGWLAVFCGVTAVLMFFALILWERRVDNPLIPMSMFAHRGLAIMFILSFCMGLVMFSLLIYVPLLLQGGFGLNPQQVGVLITPMVVCITVGSMTNSRMVVRMSHPTRILYAGFAFLVVSCVGLMIVDEETHRAVLVAVLMGAGIGLGFILPNLNIFVQEMAGRTLLGISTAVLQSIRMVGGMVGTTLVGTVVAQCYIYFVQALGQGEAADRWLPRLQDPQVLVNQTNQSEFVAEMQRLGLHGEPFLLAARDALITSIHIGLGVVLLFALVGLVWVYRMPPLQFGQPPAPPVPPKSQE